jgi:NHL repeat
MRIPSPQLTTFRVLLCCLALAGCSGAISQAQKPASSSPGTPSLQYIAQWGVKGDGAGQLNQPSGIASGARGDVFIADPGSAYVTKFAYEGKPMLSFQEDGMNHPQSITLDSGGGIYVADSVRNSVFIFLPSGDRYRELHLRTRTAVGNFLSVAVTSDGMIHILDPAAGKIFTYTSRLRLVQTSEPRETVHGTGHFGPLVRGNDDNLYLGTPSGGIMKLTHDGRLVTELVASNGAQWNPNTGFAVAYNSLFVMDPNGLTVHVVSTDGTPKLDADLAPQLGEGHRRPPAIAISSRSELLILDAEESRVLRYHIAF